MASGSCEIKTEYAEDIENWMSDLRTAREQVMIILNFRRFLFFFVLCVHLIKNLIISGIRHSQRQS